MNEEKAVEVTEGYLNSLQLSRMRADICKMITGMEVSKNIESCYYFIKYLHGKELSFQKHFKPGYGQNSKNISVQALKAGKRL